MGKISEGTACFMIKDKSLTTYDGEFWEYLRKEGFESWGKHGNWGCDWVYHGIGCQEQKTPSQRNII